MTDLRRHVAPVASTWDDEVPGRLWRELDSTLVFADVSGFTALTERLSRRGRIGAEEIVETLNRVFGPMLILAASRGGELLKFGGDALLFLFRGEGHPEQACDAAVEMRAALRASAAMPTAVGRLSLSMSVGIHSGPVHLFNVGEPTRELLVLGPAATQTALAEKAAEAGQIVVSPSSAGRLAPGAVRARDDGALVLVRRRARTRPAGPSPIPEVSAARLSTLFPVDLGQYLAPGPPDPEHRLACISFVRFSGTDALHEARGPDALAEALHTTVTGVQAALASEGVTLLATDLDTDGGKFFLGTGIPAANEDHEGQMLRAMRRIADGDLPLPIQIGVNRGHVFATEVGIATRGAFTGMGDTTNTAARIAAKAPPGTIYAHPAVLEHSRTRFAVAPAGPFPVKGKALPLLVYEVGEELGTGEPAAQTRLPLLGRDDEVEAIRAGLAEALAGAGGVVTLTGATGMGKTRVAHEAIRRSVPARLLALRAEPYGATSAFRVFRDPMRDLLGIVRGAPDAMGAALLRELSRLAPDLLPLAPLIADVAAVEVPSTPEVDALDPQFRPDRLADAVVALLDRAIPEPLLILVEEAHWADGASSRLLGSIVTAAAGRRWAVLVVRRQEGGGFAPTTGRAVEVGPLPDAVIEALVIAATEATPLRPHEVAAVVSRAAGSPLFVEEVTRVATGTGSLAALPDTVQAAMSAQVDLLPAHIRRVLRYCAVLGRSFRIDVLRRTLAADGLHLDQSALAALSGFLDRDGETRMRFRSGLIRDAAYEGLAFRSRARIHNAAGLAIESLSTDPAADAPTLALHFSRGGDAARTWRYAQQAGESARRSYANADAATLYEQALEAGRRLPEVSDAERAETWAVLGELRELSGVLDGSVEAYRRAAALAPDPALRADMMARRARVHSRAGSPGTAVRTIGSARRLLHLAPGEDRARRVGVRLDYLMAVARLVQEKPQEGRKWAERAAASARELGDPHTLIRALLAVDVADQQLGRPSVGEHTQEALRIAMDSGDKPQESVARANLGVLAFYAGRWDEATTWLTTSAAVAIEAGNDFGAAETDLTYADILIHRGRLDEAEDVLRNAFRVLKASGIDVFAAHAQMLQAQIRLARGELAEAEALAGSAAREFHEMDSDVDALEADLVRAEAVIELGRPEEALEIVAQAVRGAHGEGAAFSARIEIVRSLALLSLGRPLEAGQSIATGLASAREQDLPFEEALLLALRSTGLPRPRRPGDDGSDAEGSSGGDVPGAGGPGVDDPGEEEATPQAADRERAERLLAELGATMPASVRRWAGQGSPVGQDSPADQHARAGQSPRADRSSSGG